MWCYYVRAHVCSQTNSEAALTRALCALVKQARPSEQADNSSV